MRRVGVFEGESAMSRWRSAGRAPLRWGPGAASDRGRTFDEDLALFERQILGSLPRDPDGMLPAAASGAKAA